MHYRSRQTRTCDGLRLYIFLYCTNLHNQRYVTISHFVYCIFFSSLFNVFSCSFFNPMVVFSSTDYIYLSCFLPDVFYILDILHLSFVFHSYHLSKHNRFYTYLTLFLLPHLLFYSNGFVSFFIILLRF